MTLVTKRTQAEWNKVYECFSQQPTLFLADLSKDTPLVLSPFSETVQTEVVVEGKIPRGIMKTCSEHKQNNFFFEFPVLDPSLVALIKHSDEDTKRRFQHSEGRHRKTLRGLEIASRSNRFHEPMMRVRITEETTITGMNWDETKFKEHIAKFPVAVMEDTVGCSFQMSMRRTQLWQTFSGFGDAWVALDLHIIQRLSCECGPIKKYEDYRFPD